MSTTRPPRSSAQIAASRINGAKSKGPVSQPGKHHSSLNSTRHALLAKTIVFHGESERRFLVLLRDLFHEYQPATPTEVMLVETMAAARWTLLRTWTARRYQANRALAAPSPLHEVYRIIETMDAGPDDLCSPVLLHHYEMAADRQFTRALIRLQHAQQARTKRPWQSVEKKDSTPPPNPRETHEETATAAPRPELEQ